MIENEADSTQSDTQTTIINSPKCDIIKHRLTPFVKMYDHFKESEGFHFAKYVDVECRLLHI